MSADLLALLVRMTLAASAAIVVVLLLRRPVRTAFGAQVAYALWLLVPAATLAAFLPARVVFIPHTLDATANAAVAGAEAAPSIESAADAGGLASVVVEQTNWLSFDISPLLLTVWLAGFVFGVLVLLSDHRRVTRCADDAGPAVVGVLRPRIVLPRDFETRYTPAERDLVLAHERSHLAAFDPQINALAAILHCLNWFNPLFHMARKALRVDQELACDARVMARHGESKRIYAEAMLKAQLTSGPILLGCQWPPVGAGPLKQRIAMLARPRPTQARSALGAGVCALALMGMTAGAWLAQPPRIAYAQERAVTAAQRALGAQLVEALMEGRSDEARDLIDAGADVNHFARGDGTPLTIAARRGDLAMVNLLIERGANVNQRAPGDGNPLIMASAFGHLDVVTTLIEHGADVNGIVTGDETPLINAARANQLETARLLIARGADVNLAVRTAPIDGNELRSPVIMARRGGHDDMVRLLQSHGATG